MTTQQHPRDHYVIFDEAQHKYTINHPQWLAKRADGTGTISVTTLIHQLFPPFDAHTTADRIVANITRKRAQISAAADPTSVNLTDSERKYWGMSVTQILNLWEEQRQQASQLGTSFHQSVEDYLNSQGQLSPAAITIEFRQFLNFWQDLTTQYPRLTVYRTEWMVFDEEIGLAGSIDCVLRDQHGNLIIVDWKRSKEIKLSNCYQKGLSVFSLFDDCNWSHYQLQLNFYREILQRHYQEQVIYMMNVVCHPDHPNYLCYPVPYIDVSPVWSQLPTLAQQYSNTHH